MTDLFDYRPAPFWFLNHKLEKEEIKRQIGLMKNCGVSGFFMHPRAGLLTPYGSDEWFDVIKYVVELAEEAGLKAWLYDEDPFPSGIAGGWVVFDNPGYAARSVRVKKLLPNENGRVVSSLGRGRLLSVIALKTDSSGKISEFMELTGAVGIIRSKFFKTPFDCAYYSVMIDEKKYEHVRAETSYPELHIDVELEGPEWVVYVSIDDIIRVGDQSGVFPDNLSRECVRSFLNFTHEKYNKILGGRFGNSIPGIFTDEAVPGGWTPGFAELFEKEKGYKIESNFHHFVDTFGPESRKIRQDYWSVLHEMFKENFFGQISSWCRQHSLKLTGHVWGEDDPLNHVFAGGNAFAYQKYFDIPGFDIVGTNLGDRIYPGLNFGGKLISSAAHQQGKRQVISECFGGNPFNFGMDGMMKFAGWLFSLGITWLSPHGFHYSYDGDRKFDCGKSYFLQDENFGDFSKFAEYAGRMGSTLASADHECSVCLLHPVHGFWQLCPVEMEKGKKLREQLFYTVRTLFEEHVEFDIIDDDTLQESIIENGFIKCGEEKYCNIIIPDNSYLPDDYFSQIKSFENRGLKVITSDSCGKVDMELLRGSGAIMTDIANKQYGSDHKNLMLLRKKTGNDKLVFVFNNSETPGYFTISGEGSDYCYIYEAMDDRYLDTGCTGGEVHFEAGGYNSLLFVFTDKKIQDASLYRIPAGLTPAAFEYEKNPLWDYIPPQGCRCSINRWDISVSGSNMKQDINNHPFCLIRDIAGTELQHIKNLNPRPWFDTAKEVKSIYPLKAEYKASFNIPEAGWNGNDDVMLLMEGDTLQGDCKIYINGHEMKKDAFSRKNIYDYFNLIASASSYINHGENEIRITWDSASEFDGLKSSIYLI